MIEQEGNSGIFKHFLVYTLFEVHRKKQKKTAANYVELLVQRMQILFTRCHEHTKISKHEHKW
jgi:hypothetical protein